MIDSLYGHLDTMLVHEGQQVVRGQQIATMGTAHGMYDAHLHFEIRKNITVGMYRSAFPRDFTIYHDPTQFVTSHRQLRGGGIGTLIAMNTFVPYPGTGAGGGALAPADDAYELGINRSPGRVAAADSSKLNKSAYTIKRRNTGDAAFDKINKRFPGRPLRRYAQGKLIHSFSPHPLNAFHDFLDECAANILALRELEAPFTAAVEKVAACLLDGGKLLVCGNGGSASDSSHLVSEFVIRFVEDRRSYAALALASDGGLLTAGANDYGFDEVFARQIRGLGRPGDVLIVFTTSGKSPNIIRALEAAREGRLVTIAFLGRGGGHARGLADVEMIVPGTESTARIQEAHKVLLHRLCEQVEKLLPRW